jgi:hypothetical protein
MAPYHPCAPDLLMMIAIGVAFMMGLCQLASFFIRTPATPYVFFFVNTLTLCFQTCFIIVYGVFHMGPTLRTLAEDADYFHPSGKCLSFFVLVLAVFGPFEFASFIASFCVNLDDRNTMHLFVIFCERIPLGVCVPTALVLQDVMDTTANHLMEERRAVDVTLI